MNRINLKLKRLMSLALALLLALCMAGCSDLLYVLEAVAEVAAEEAINGTVTEQNEGYQGGESAIENVEVTEAEAESEDEANACSPQPAETVETVEEQSAEPEEELPAIDEYGTYTAKDDVALYIHTYGKLPQNFITKEEARSLGWEGGSLERYAPGYSIGGDRFGNYEGLLPTAKGRKYTECDIDTLNRSSRGAKRIVFSNDGLIYYTDDHYASFELLYGEE